MLARAFGLAALFFLLLPAPAWTQDGVGARQVRFRTYTPSDGLSQATARALVQDRDGFVWIGTQDGLNRFDGYSFRVYKHDRNDPTTLSHNHVWALLADPDGSVWIGTQAGGLDRYDPTHDRFVAYASGNASDSTVPSQLVTALLLDRGGRIWVANGDGRLQWVDRKQQRLIDTPLGGSPGLRMVYAMLQTLDGTIWIGTSEGLYRTTTEAKALVEVRAGEQQPLFVYALAQTPDGNLWVGTDASGLYRLDAGGELLDHYRHDAQADPASTLHDDELRTLLAEPDGGLWIGGNSHGLAYLDATHRRFTRFEHDATRSDTIAANRLAALIRERNGLLFAGSWTNGFSVYDPRTRALALIDRVAEGAQVTPLQSALTISTDPDGTLWCGITPSGGLLHLTLAGEALRHYRHDPARPDSLAHDFVQYVTRTGDGSLWVATMGGGLDRLKPDGSGFEHLRHDAADPASLASDRLLFVGTDRAGTLWVGTSDAGLDERCAGCSGFRHHRHDPSDPYSAAGDAVSGVRELGSGEFWVSYRTAGLDRLDRKSGRFEHFRSRAGDPYSLSADVASVMIEDSHGDLWIGTQGGGLDHRVTRGTVTRFEAIDSRDGLASDAIGAIVETAPGIFWVSTTSGISRIERNAGDTPHILNYGARNGAQQRGYWVNAVARLPDGRIAFGGLDGISVLDPHAVEPPPPPRPLMTALLLSNVPAGPGDSAESPLHGRLGHGGKVVLNHEQDNVTFEFSALDYSDPESMRYAYKLDGHDEQWIETTASRRLATYTDLAAGTYRLHLRVRPQGGEWIESSAPVDIRVLPAPWRSPLAYAIYTAALALCMLLAWLTVRATLRRRAAVQDAMRHGAERLKLALWGSGSELWDVDLASGRMVRENRLEHLAANSEATEQTMQAYTPFVHPEDLGRFDAALRAHLRGLTPTFECSYRTLDDRHNWIWVLTRGRAQRDANGRAVRISGTNHDISHLKAAEEALLSLNEELESRVEQRTTDLREANLKLRGTLDILTLAQRQLIETEKLASLGGMVAGIAHEINTPLGISVTAASHLQDETRRLSRLVADGQLTRSALERFEGSARESTDIVLRNLQRADRLVKSFKQVAVDQSSEERRVVDLGANLDEIITTLGPSVKSSACRIVLNCPQTIIAETAPGALYQIITNLVMNSLTHGFAPGRSARPAEAVDRREGLAEPADDQDMRTPSEIRIDVRRDESVVRIDYRDNGRGMDETVRSRIFEPFFTTRRGQGGSGLGMHIVYNLVTQSLQGSIECDSAPRQGVLFRIVLPAPMPS